MTEIGKTIKSIRKQQGLTQKQLGEILTVSQAYISSVEHGREKPTLMFIKLFCLLYSVNEALLMN